MFVGYDFFYNRNALSPLFGNAKNIGEWQIQQGVFKQVNVQSGIVANNIIPPTEWGATTLGNCVFDNTINLGNIGYLSSTINSIRLKRAKKGTENWQQLAEVFINDDPLNFKFKHHDYFAKSSVQYKYALVTVDYNGVEQASNQKEVFSEFSQVVISDSRDVFYLTNEFTIASASRVQQTGVYDPIGSQVPLVVKNGILNYNRMTTSATLLMDTTKPTIDSIQQLALVDKFLNFLTNGLPKILKDFNGNAWLIMIIGSPTTTYLKEMGNNLITISFEWAEMGNSEQQEDMNVNGLTPIKPIFENHGIINNLPYGVPIVHNYPTGKSTLEDGIIVYDNTIDS